MRAIQLKQIRKYDLFTLTPIESPTDKQVYVRYEYDKSSKKYSCYKFSNVNSERFFKADKIVYVDFEF